MTARSGRALHRWLAATVAAAISVTMVVAAPLRVTFAPDTQRLEIATENLERGDYELVIETEGLRRIETGADVNEPGIVYLPPPKAAMPNAEPGEAENVFFFNELQEAPDWELVAGCGAEARGAWKLNGRFSPLGGELKREIVIPVARLEPGENLLHVRAKAERIPTLVFRRRFAAVENDGVASTLTLAHAAWNGRVLLRRKTGEGWAPVAERTVTTPAPAARPVGIGERWWENRPALTEAALAVGRNVLRSQVRQPGSMFEGGFHLVYDPSRPSHRMSHWLWSWGPTIDLLLKLSRLEAARAEGLSSRFHAAALAAGRCSLRFGMTNPAHPAHGVSTVRWEPSRATPSGCAEYLSTADSLFLAGWGWMALHAETGEPEYLRRTQTLVDAATRLMAQFPVVPQDWIMERGDWTPHTLDESVFGLIGFRRLFEATEAPEAAAAGRRFLDSHLRHMGRPGGLLARAWLRDEDKEIWDPDIKGHAWVIEGYLDAYQLSGDTKYLELADQLAERVRACQASDGSWTYLFKQPADGDPIDDKGTAIWAYLFYELHRRTQNPEHLAAARRALGWCLRQQYRGDDPNLDGAIFHPNSMAYVRRRPMTILYTTTFFGQALLEELALGDRR